MLSGAFKKRAREAEERQGAPAAPAAPAVQPEVLDKAVHDAVEAAFQGRAGELSEEEAKLDLKRARLDAQTQRKVAGLDSDDEANDGAPDPSKERIRHLEFEKALVHHQMEQVRAQLDSSEEPYAVAQLRDELNQCKAANAAFAEQNEQLRQENARLRQENAQLRADEAVNYGLRADEGVDYTEVDFNDLGDLLDQ